MPCKSRQFVRQHEAKKNARTKGITHRELS